ncbi:MAG: hypothetical protein K2G44_01580 [Clostridia bacterium]|nr:hypothetical protein [Clostridia bacterium]
MKRKVNNQLLHNEEKTVSQSGKPTVQTCGREAVKTVSRSKKVLAGVLTLILSVLMLVTGLLVTLLYNNNNGGQELGGNSHVAATTANLTPYLHEDVAEASTWDAAVQNSSASSPRKYKLTADWTAYFAWPRYVFGTNGNCYWDTALYVPTGKSVILDLNGHTINGNNSDASQTGRGDVIVVGGTLIITDSSESGTGKITGGKMGGNSCSQVGGGGLTILSGGTVTLERGAITGNEGHFNNSNAGGVGGVYVAGTFNMTGGSVNGNRIGNDVFNNEGRPNSTAGIWITSTGKMNMSGGTVSGNALEYSSGAIRREYATLGIRVEGTLNMTGGVIEAHTIPNDTHYASSYGVAGVLVQNGGSFTMEGGTIRNNKSLYTGGDSYGAGLFLNTNAVFNMKGGTISGNQLTKNANATRAAGIFCGAGVTLNITGGTITGNTATGTNSVGGVICAPTTKIENATITNNTGALVGGMYLGTTTSTSFAGTNNISGNKVGSTASNLYLPADAKINVTGGLTGSNIGVTSVKGGLITNGFEEHNPGVDPADIFIPDNPKVEITLEDGEASYFLRTNANLWTKAIQTSVANGTQETFRLIEDWTAQSYTGLATNVRSFTEPLSTASAAYYQSCGYVWSATNNYGALYVPATANIILDLNGYSIDRGLTSAATYGFVILMEGKLTIIDSKAPEGGYAPVLDANGNLMKNADGTVQMNAEGGRIKGGWSSTGGNGGGIHVNPGATLNLVQGVISGNRVTAGTNSTFAAGVKLYGNTTTAANFNMTGGVIADNVATTSNASAILGGGIQATYANLNITGGYVAGNTVTSSTSGYSASGISVHLCPSVNVENVKVLGNEGITGITVYQATAATLKNVTVSGNRATTYNLAGGAYLVGNANTVKFKVEDCTFTNNVIATSSSYAGTGYWNRAGGLWCNTGDFTITDTIIANNTTNTGSGGLSFTTANAKLDNVIIAGNTTTYAADTKNGTFNAGGLLVNASTVTATHCHIGSVSAEDNELNGKEYGGNTATANLIAGIISLMNSSVFTFENGTMNDNSSQGHSLSVRGGTTGACTLNLKNVDLIHNEVGYGQAFMLAYGFAHTLNFENVTAERNVSGSSAFALEHSSTLNWNGGRISNNTLYSVILAGTSSVAGSVYLSNVDITDNDCTGNPISVNYVAGSSFVMEGGSISGNDSTLAGGAGAIYVSGSSAAAHGVCRLTDVDVVGNTGYMAGGVYVTNYAEFSMVGGKLEGNTSRGSVGGLRIDANATALLENVVVRSNKALATVNTTAGGIYTLGALTLKTVTIGTPYEADAEKYANKGAYGGLWVNTSGTLTLSGAVVIANNDGEAANNFYYNRTDKKITVAGDLRNSEIYMGTSFIGTFTEGYGLYNTVLPETYFLSDEWFSATEPKYIIGHINEGTALEGTIRQNTNEANWTFAVQTSYSNPSADDPTLGTLTTFKLISDWNANSSGAFNGNIAAAHANGYQSNGSIMVPNVNGVQANIILDLNGYTINRGGNIATGAAGPANGNGYVIYVQGHLTVIDSKMKTKDGRPFELTYDEEGIPHTNAVAPYYDEETGEVVTGGTGTITGANNTTANYGGAFLVGGLTVPDPLNYSLNLLGGNIVNNRSTGNYTGSAITARYKSHIYVENTYFGKNYASGSYSSTITSYLSTTGDTVTVDNCLFVNNTSAASYTLTMLNTSFNVTNSEVRNGSSYGIYYESTLEDTECNIEHVKIIGNKSGINIPKGVGTFTDVIINGGDVGLSVGTLAATSVKAYGVQILNSSVNNASNAAVVVGAYGSLEMYNYTDSKTGEEIPCRIDGSKNAHASGAAALYINGGTFKMEGTEDTPASISNNVSPNSSNLIYTKSGANVELTNVDIKGNTAKANLIGLETTVAKLTDVNITGNTATAANATILVAYTSSELTMTGGSISDNTISATNSTGYGVLTIGYNTAAASHAELYGVTIDGNHGGYATVFVNSRGDSLVMTDCSVTNNTSSVTNAATVIVNAGNATTYGSLSLNNTAIDGNTAPRAALLLGGSAAFSMTGGSVSNNTTTHLNSIVFGLGGSVKDLNGNVGVTLDGVTVSGNNCTRAITLGGDTSFAGLRTSGIGTWTDLVLNNCEISENHGAYFGGIVGNSGVNLTLNNTTVQNNTGVKAGGIYSQGELTLNNSHVDNNTAEGSLNSGDKGAAGGIFVNSGVLNLGAGSSVSGNTCSVPESAGGIYVKGIVEMTGGDIIGNTATGSASAGGVYIFGAATTKLNMSGGSITLNSASDADEANNVKMGAGGVYVAGSGVTAGTLAIEGNVTIDTNLLNGAQQSNSNVYVVDAENVMILVTGELSTSSSVGVYRRPIGVFTKDFGTHNPTVLAEAIFHSDLLLSEVASYDTVREEVVKTAGADIEGYTISYDNEINWAFLVNYSLNHNGETQTFVLYGDWVAPMLNTNTTSFGSDLRAFSNGALQVPAGANMIIELNGSSIDRNLYRADGSGTSAAGRDSGYVITVAGGGTLIIQDNHRKDDSLIREGINDREQGAVYNGSITGGNNATRNRAGGIYVAQNGTLTLKDGMIAGNRGSGSAPVAGGVYVDGTFDMYGGAVNENFGDSAGGIYVSATGTFTLFAGEIKNNSSVSSTNASGVGGVRVVNNGVMYFGDGVSELGKIEISGNTLSTGVNSNLKSDNESYQFQVNGKFGDGTQIGVTRGMNAKITEGYGQYNNVGGTEIDPRLYFFSDDEDHFVTQEGSGTDTEAIMFGYNNRDNWTYAVETSLRFEGATQTFMLYSDWTASRPASTNYTSEFGSNTNAYYRGALYVPAGASIILNLRGHVLDRGLSQNEIRADGFVIYVLGELIIIDEPDSHDETADIGIITGGASRNLAGGVVVGNGGELTLKGGVISGNIASYASGSAGGVYVYGSGDTHFTMTGGEITENRGYDAGGVYVDNGLGGDRNGTFTMTGGSITENRAVSSNIGGVRVNTTGIIELGGGAIIKDNSNGELEKTSNLYLMYANNSGSLATVPPNIQVVEAFTNAADIHITRETIGQFTEGFEESGTVRSTTDVFTSDNDDYFVDTIEVEITLEDGTTKTTHEAFMKCYLASVNWSYTVQMSLTTGTTQTFTLEYDDWTAELSASDGTSFGRGVGYEQGRLWVPVGASIILDLNGHTIDRALDHAVQNGEVFFVQGELTIIDKSDAKTGTIMGGYSTGTGGIYNSGKLTIEAGTITGNRSTAVANGAGIYNSGTLTMTGGTVTGNSGYRAGIYQDTTGIINLGGSVKIDGNFYETEGEDGDTVQTPSNLYIKSNTGVINVIKPFTSGAKISLIREGIGVLTNGYGVYNTVNPETYFVSESPNNIYEVSHIGEGTRLEAAIVSFDNATNWTHAVKTSLANQGAVQTFTLYSNWTPDENHSFGNDVGYLGGALYVPQGANIILDLNGYTIDREFVEAVTRGYVFDIAGSLTIIDSSDEKTGVITGGYSTNTAGGIHVENNGWVDLQEGTLKGNATTSSRDGGAITVNGKLSMTGGVITENEGVVCGGVYVSTSGTLELGGKAKIFDNTKGEDEQANIYLESSRGMVTIISNFTEDAYFTITRKGIGPFTTGYGAFATNVEVTFVSEDELYIVERTSNGQELQMITKDNRLNWEYAVQTSLDTGTTQEFKLWDDWNATNGVFGTTAPYYLNGALNVPVGASISFNLNGKALNRGLTSARANGYVMYVSGELILNDLSSEQTGVFKGGYNSSGSSTGGVYVNRNATFTMNGGRISENSVQGAGGGGVYNNGNFTLNGGVIGAFETDEVSYGGNSGLAGGVFNGPYGTFVMNGGSINGNTSVNNAGGVYIYNSVDSIFIMNGGSITNNTAEDAGGVYVSGKFNMTGGEISGNTAKGTNVTKGGGSGVYVSSSGVFTMTGGVVKENVGLNGVRVYSSGTLNVGGTAQVYNNKNERVYDSTDPHEYRNVYLTVGTQFVNVVEKFEEGAFIGVTRDASGIFTAEYGTYNPNSSPANYFQSDVEAYAVSSAQSNVTGTIEGVIGTPVQQPSKTESPVYDGEWHAILVDYNPKYMSYGPLPQGVIYDEDEGAFKAVNAGEYTISFTLKEGFCWPDGTSGTLNLIVKIEPRVAELEWKHLDDLVYNTREQTPTAIVTNLVPGDVCDVYVTGGQIHAGSYVATASFLSNSNYTLKNAKESDIERGFTISKAEISVEILNDSAAYNTPQVLKVNANVGKDGITFIVIDNTWITYEVDAAGASLIDLNELAGGIILAKEANGTIYVTAVVGETQDTLPATSDPKEIKLTKATPNLGLAETTVEYGTDLELKVTGNDEASATLTLVNGTGEAVLNGTTLTPVKAGKVKITISTEETDHYFAKEVTVTVDITPKVLVIEWDGPFEFKYDGFVHGPEAHATNLVGNDECKIIVGGQQTDAGEYLGENGAHALLTSNPNYTLEGAENLYHDFVILQVPLPVDDKISLVKNTVHYGDTLTLEITGNREDAEVFYEISEPQAWPANRQRGEAVIYYDYGVDEEGNRLTEGDRLDPFTAILEPTGSIGFVLVKVTIGESKNYTGCVYYEYVEILKAKLDASFYTDAERELREVVYGDENCLLEVVGNPENGKVEFTVLGGTGEVQIEGNVLKALRVGQVNIRMHIAATDHYDEQYVSAIITVKPRPVILSWTLNTLIYNGEEQAPVASVANLAFGDRITVLVEGAVNAGIHTARAIGLTGERSENYTLEVEEGALAVTTPFEIQPRKIESITWGNTELLFNGKTQVPAYTLVGLVYGDTCELVMENAGRDVGRYTATAVGVKNTNYYIDETTANRTITYTIIKAPITLQILNEYVLYYNEVQVELEGNIGDGEITYTITTNPSGIATISKDGVIFASDYGYVTIRVEVAETNNTYSGWVEKTVPVKKGEASLDFVKTDVIYGDTLDLEFASIYHPDQISITLQNGTDEAGTGMATLDVINRVLTATGAGEVTLVIYTRETDRYLETVKEITITIHKRILTVEWKDEFTYDGTEKLPVAEEIGNLAFNDRAPEITLEGAQIDAGEYIATVTGISNPNYALLVDEENSINGYLVPFKITKAGLDIEVRPEEIFIDQERVPVEILNNPGGNNFTLELVNDTGSADLIMERDEEGNVSYYITPSAVGEVVLIVHIPASDNYLAYDGQFTITISRLAPEIDLETVEVFYGDNLTLSVTGEGTADREVTYSVANGTGSAELVDATTLLGTGVGTVIVTVTLAETDIYEEQTFEVIVTVKKRPVVLTWDVGEYVYNGEEQAPEATIDNTVFGDTVNVTVRGNINAGSNLIAEAIELDNENYTIVGGTNITVTYTIDRKIVEIEWDEDTRSFIYDCNQHQPTAVVKSGLIEGDECDVIVSGAQTDAYDAWEAAVSGLSNPNYDFDHDSEANTTTFEIKTADPEVTLNEVEVRYHELSELSVTVTPIGGDVTYTIIAGNEFAEIRNGNKIYGLELGTITLQIHVDSTMGSAGVLNTYEKTIEVEITIQKGWQPYELDENTVVYGSDLELELKNYVEAADYKFLEIIRIEGDDGDATLSGNVLTPVHVGKVKVKVEYAETDHYEKTIRELEVTITPYVLEFTWDNAPADEKLIFTYNGQEQAPKAIPEKLFGDDECEILVQGARNAGNWTARATGTSNPNYTIVGSNSIVDHPTQNFTIKPLTVIVEWNDTTLEYTATAQTPKANIANKVEGDVVSFVYEGAQTEMGTYTGDERARIVGLTGRDSGNYTLEGVDAEDLETDFEIVKGHINLRLSTSSTNITYLQSVTVTLTGNIGGGEVTYQVVSGSGRFNTDANGRVTFTPGGAGRVVIRAYVAETEKTYEGYSNTVTIEVAKANWSVGFSYSTNGQNGVAYYGTTTTLRWAPGVSPGFSYTPIANDKGGSWINVNTFRGYGVGTYSIFVTWGGNANFKAGSTWVSIRVQRLPLTIDWQTLEFTYNGTQREPVVVTHTQVTEKGDHYAVRFSGLGTNAGSYVANAVGLKDGGDTYYVLTGDNLSSSYTIGRAEIDPKIITTDAEYGVPLQLLVSGNLGDGRVTYEILPGGTGSATIDGDILNPTGLGTVIVKAYVEETRNYHGGECTAIITIGKRIPQLGIDRNTVVYGDTLQLNVTGNEENGQILFSVRDETGSATITPTSGILTPVSVGTVTVIISITETASFRAFTIEREITITPRPIQIEWDEDTLEFEYDGTLKTPVANVVSGLVEGDSTGINVLGGKINAGVYTATASSCTNPNYMIDPESDNINVEFVITPQIIEIRIEQTEAYLGVPVTLTVSSNLPIDQSRVIFTVTAAGGNATLEGNVITGTQYGQVIVNATLPASTNYQGATDMRVFEIKKFAPNIGLEKNEVVYGSTLDLVITGNLGEGAASIALANKAGDSGMASLNGMRLRGLAVGKVTLIVTIAPTPNYEGGDFEVEVNVVPRPVVLVWGGEDQVFEFQYNGKEQYPEARVINALPGDECNVTLIQGAVNAGNHVAKALELDNANYTVVNALNIVNDEYVRDVSFTITKRVAELEWEDEEFIYNGRMQAPTAKIRNLLPEDEGKSIQIVVTGETHATKTWDGEVAIATATMISDANYTLVGSNSISTEYVIEQLEAELIWDDPAVVDYGSEVTLPGAIVGNKALQTDECDVLVKKYEPTQTFALFAAGAGSRAGTVSNTCIAEAYGFEGANKDDYKLPEDNLKEYIENAKEITVNFGSLELVYNGQEQYPTWSLTGVQAGDDVSVEFSCDEEPINVKYASDNVTIASYTAKLKLVGKDAEHYAIDILQQETDEQGNMQALVDFKIVPRPVTVYATSKDVQLLLELDENGKFVLDKFTTKDWEDWFFLTCDELVGKDIGADVHTIFDAENLFLSPAFYRITRDEQGNIVSISDERVIPGQEGPDISMGEYKIGIIIENLTRLDCLTGNYIAEVKLSDDYGILTILRDDAVLKLDVLSGYEFLYLEEDGWDIYRRAYTELGWKHGEDDALFERVVLGQVMPETTVDMFLANIHQSQMMSIRIYDSYGNLIYDCGQMIDSEAFIGTGSKIQLMLGGEAIDTVYVSVLGDTDGDGELKAKDSSNISQYIMGKNQSEKFELDEYILAALLQNEGIMSAKDASTVTSIIYGKESVEDYFYKKQD